MGDLETPYLNSIDVRVQQNMLEWARTRKGTEFEELVHDIMSAPDLNQIQRMEYLEKARSYEAQLQQLRQPQPKATTTTTTTQEPQKPGLISAFEGGLKRGIDYAGNAYGGLLELGGYAAGMPKVEQAGKSIAEFYKKRAESVKVPYGSESMGEMLVSPLFWADTIGQAIPSIAEFMAGGFAGRKIYLGLSESLTATPQVVRRLIDLGQRLKVGERVGTGVAWGAETLGRLYAEAVSRGHPPSEAAKMAEEAAAFNTALGFISTYSFLGKTGGLVKRGLRGAGMMDILSFLSGTNEGVVQGEPIEKALKDAARGLPQSTVLGAGLGMLGGGREARPEAPGRPGEPSARPPEAKPPPEPKPTADPVIERMRAEEATAKRVDQLAKAFSGARKPSPAEYVTAREVIEANPDKTPSELIPDMMRAWAERLAPERKPTETVSRETPTPEPEPQRAIYTDQEGRPVPGTMMPEAERPTAAQVESLRSSKEAIPYFTEQLDNALDNQYRLSPEQEQRIQQVIDDAKPFPELDAQRRNMEAKLKRLMESRPLPETIDVSRSAPPAVPAPAGEPPAAAAEPGTPTQPSAPPPYLAGLKETGGSVNLRFESRQGRRVPTVAEIESLFPGQKVSVEARHGMDPQLHNFVVTFFTEDGAIDYPAARAAAEKIGGEFTTLKGGPGSPRIELGKPSEVAAEPEVPPSLSAPPPPADIPTVEPARIVTPGPERVAGEPGPPPNVQFQPDVGAPVEVPRERVEKDTRVPGFAHVPGGVDGPYARALRALQANEEWEAGRIAAKKGRVGHEESQRAADALRREGKVTVWSIHNRPDVAFATPEEARASVDVVLGARDYADGVRRKALKEGFDEEGAANVQMLYADLVRKVSVGASLTGRTLESFKMTGIPADIAETFLVTGGLPISGPEGFAERARQIIQSVGNPRQILEQVEGLNTKRQRDGLGSLQWRLGKAGMEQFFSWLFSPLTASGVLASGFVTAARDIAITGTEQAGRRLLNAVAPEYVEAVRGNPTLTKIEALTHGLTTAWASLKRIEEARFRVMKAEGFVKGEQQFQQIVRREIPGYNFATRTWDWEPKVTGDKFYELRQHGSLGEAIGMALDWIGATTRLGTLDLLAEAHGVSFALHDGMGAYAKAAEIAEGRGLTGQARIQEINRLLQERPVEVDKAGIENGKYQTFLSGFEGELSRMVAPLNNWWARLLIAPVVGFPIRAGLMAAETIPGLGVFVPKMRAEWAAGNRGPVLAKQALGLSLFVVGTALTHGGAITGKRPVGPLGDVWDAQNKQEYSFKIGNRYFSYRGIAPLLEIFGTVANFAQGTAQLTEDHPVWQEIPVALWAMGHAVMDLGITQGISRWVDALRSKDANEAEKLLSRQLQPPTPMGGTLGIMARQVDPVRRAAHTWSEHVLQRIPWGSTALKPMRNIVTGEPLLHEGMFGPGSSSKFATHEFFDSAGLKEIDRLQGAGLRKVPDHIYGARPPEFLETQKLRPPGVKLTDAQIDRWEVLMTQEVKSGGKNLRQALDALVQKPSYQKYGDLEKAAQIQGLWNDYFVRGRELLLREDRELAAKVRAVEGETRIRHLPVERQAQARERLLGTLH